MQQLLNKNKLTKMFVSPAPILLRMIPVIHTSSRCMYDVVRLMLYSCDVIRTGIKYKPPLQ